MFNKMVRSIFFLTASIAQIGLIVSLPQVSWEEFKKIHHKSNSLQEDFIRQQAYLRNKQYVEKFNANHAQRLGYDLQLTRWADRIWSEFSIRGLSYNNSLDHSESANGPSFLASILNNRRIEVPDELDWRKVANRVTPVKKQGQCGSCWAFAAVGALEGQFEGFGEKLVGLSEQMLLDCSMYGCTGGGSAASAFNFIARQGGIVSSVSYPYRGVKGNCELNMSQVVMKINGSAILPEGDEEILKEVVAKFGPVAAVVNSNYETFLRYKSGYGTDPKWGDYWIVKNSWSSSWGSEGYILMARNRNNQCGIATRATIPVF